MVKKILICLTVFAILTSAVQIPVFALTDYITSVSDNSVRGSNDRVSTLQAEQEVKFNGTAIEYFSSTGTCSWNVRVDTIISGTSGLQGHTVTVALWSGDSGEFPSGSMDPEIEPGDSVGVYGLYVSEDYVTLSGSEEYYITKTSVSNQPSVTVRYPNGGESISIGTQVQVSAHATDDAAVTCVTFYYSSDGGSKWNLIGEGVKVSGTDKDGMWNRTWNTDGLSAGTNYMIKAIASDGTLTGEDQSKGTFSLTEVSPGGRLVYKDMYFAEAWESPGSVYHYNTTTGIDETVYTRPLRNIYSFAFHPEIPEKLYFVNANEFHIYRTLQTWSGWTAEEVFYTHSTYVRDITFAIDENGELGLYFSEASGAGGNGKIYKIEDSTASLYYEVKLADVDGFWAGDFAFDNKNNLYLSSGNRVPASIYKVEGGKVKEIYKDEKEPISGLAYRDGHLYYANWETTIYRLDLSTMERTVVYSNAKRNWLSDVGFGP
jgi:hypothetical protein